MSVKKIQIFDVPLKVDLNDLADKENGRLIERKEAEMLAFAMATFPPGRYSKKLKSPIETYNQQMKWQQGKLADYGIFKEPDGSLYAVYKGKKHDKELGEGAFGKAKLVQNILTGEWKVLKVQKAENPNQKDSVKNEHEILKAVGVSQGKLSKKNKKLNFIMDYAKGMELYKFLCEQPQLSPMQWLDMALQAVEGVNAIHQRGYLHCDIKLENMLYDRLTNKTTVIDYGLALKMNEQGVVNHYRRGTPGYMAPEIDKKHQVQFSKAVDVYALGKLLQEICGFCEIPDTKNIDFKTQSPFVVDKELENLLIKMTAKNPKDRPTLPDVIKKLQVLRQELLPIIPKTTGIVNINNYLKAPDKEAFIAALKSVDNVILVDDIDKNDIIYYSEIKRALQKQGVTVRNDVLISSNPTEIASKIHELDAGSKDQVEISHVCYFHSKGSVIPPAGLQAIEVTTSNKNYRKEIHENSVPLSEDQVKKVINTFDNEINRLKQKNQINNSTLQRIAALETTHKTLTSLSLNKTLTISSLSREINTLEKKLLATKKLSIITFGLFKSNSAKVVSKLSQDIKNEPTHLPKIKPH